MDFILASASPRRRELLEKHGIPFRVFVPDVTEQDSGIDYKRVALANAALKADAAAERFPDALVIGADTVIELDHEILGKPSDREHAEQMLLRMSGRSHSVVTGVCMVCRSRRVRMTFADVSHVIFRKIDLKDIRRYMDLVPVMDKAGAYAVQEYGELIIERVDGLISNVIGLPVERIAQTLRLNGLL
jgi:MAF protein